MKSGWSVRFARFRQCLLNSWVLALDDVHQELLCFSCDLVLGPLGQA